MRERAPISANATMNEVVRHIDQLHTCVDNALEKVEEALTRYEGLATTQRDDRHSSANRDMILQAGITVLLREAGYEMKFGQGGALEDITPPKPQGVLKRFETPITVTGGVLTALAGWKYLWPAIVAAHHAILAAH